MLNFDFDLPTRVHFGKGSLERLREEVLRYGRDVFFVYDAGPVKGSGLYEQIVQIFREADIRFTEFSGVEPNPRHTTVNRGIAAMRAAGAACIVAAGGGSTIDCAKAIAFGVHHEGDVWDFYCGKAEIGEVTPVIAIPTLAASGAELSLSAVLSNVETKQKMGLRNLKNRPVSAILDPTFTFTVPKFHTACGVVDIMSHTYEAYLWPEDLPLQDGLSEGIQKACITAGRQVMADPCNYEARAALQWASGLCISAVATMGRSCFSSPVHTMEHILSAYYDIAHGAGIAIMSKAWFDYCLEGGDATVYRVLAKWGRNVWGLTGTDDAAVARAAVDAFAAFCAELELPAGLGAFGITAESLRTLADAEFGRLFGADTWLRPVTDAQTLFSIYARAL